MGVCMRLGMGVGMGMGGGTGAGRGLGLDMGMGMGMRLCMDMGVRMGMGSGVEVLCPVECFIQILGNHCAYGPAPQGFCIEFPNVSRALSTKH